LILKIIRTAERDRSDIDYDGNRAGTQGEKTCLHGPMEKQNHEDKPRGICSLLILVTPFDGTRLFLLRGLLGLLGRGFLFGWHGSDHRPFFFEDQSTSVVNRPYVRVVW